MCMCSRIADGRTSRIPYSTKATRGRRADAGDGGGGASNDGANNDTAEPGALTLRPVGVSKPSGTRKNGEGRALGAGMSDISTTLSVPVGMGGALGTLTADTVRVAKAGRGWAWVWLRIGSGGAPTLLAAVASN